MFVLVHKMILFLSVSHYTTLLSFSNVHLLSVRSPPKIQRIKEYMICNVGIAENAHYAIVVQSTDSSDDILLVGSETRNTNKHNLVLGSRGS